MNSSPKSEGNLGSVSSTPSISKDSMNCTTSPTMMDGTMAFHNSSTTNGVIFVTLPSAK